VRLIIDDHITFSCEEHVSCGSNPTIASTKNTISHTNEKESTHQPLLPRVQGTGDGITARPQPELDTCENV